MTDPDVATFHWLEDGRACDARWLSANATPPPTRVTVADGSLSADVAYGLACQGKALLWRGDFHEARRLLAAMGRRADARARKGRREPRAPGEAFHLYRQARAQRARTLHCLLIPLDSDYSIPLPRAPDVRQAFTEAFGPAQSPAVTSLRTLLGAIGAHEWRIKGIDIPEAGGRIHPHFGVFAPIRREYVDLVSSTPLPAGCAASCTAFDIGTGTGVLAAVLARRGIHRVIATDLDARALDCARDNIQRLGLAEQVEVRRADLYPEGRAMLVVCNPPWIPARPSSSMEQGIYDAEGRMLRGFLDGLASHLEPGGEGWLILSDLAEHLGLRSRAQLLEAFDVARLQVVGRHDVPPRHPRATDESDPLHLARAAEVTSLWRLASK